MHAYAASLPLERPSKRGSDHAHSILHTARRAAHCSDGIHTQAPALGLHSGHGEPYWHSGKLATSSIPWEGEVHRDRNGGRCAGYVSCRVPVPAPACSALAIDHTRGGERRHREEAESPPRRLGGSPEALSPERCVYPDGAGTRSASEEIRPQEPWKLPLPEFIAECSRKRFHRERLAQVIPLAEVAKRQQPSARDKARHARAQINA